ncbi:MAG: CBS domain-containing protein [bacterium]|nr:CBS domain-containing protein [bacterium]
MYEFLDYRVLDVMTSDPVTVSPDTVLAEVEKILEEKGWNGLPVVEEGGRLQGFVTQLDLLGAFRFGQESTLPAYEQIMARPVSEVMIREVTTVTPRMPLTRALERMLEQRRKSFPVVEDHQLVGIISRRDLLGALRRAVKGEVAAGPI